MRHHGLVERHGEPRVGEAGEHRALHGQRLEVGDVVPQLLLEDRRGALAHLGRHGAPVGVEHRARAAVGCGWGGQAPGGMEIRGQSVEGELVGGAAANSEPGGGEAHLLGATKLNHPPAC